MPKTRARNRATIRGVLVDEPVHIYEGLLSEQDGWCPFTYPDLPDFDVMWAYAATGTTGGEIPDMVAITEPGQELAS